jgi:hypothetical protein
MEVYMDCAIAVKTMIREISTARGNINKALAMGNRNAQVAVIKFLDDPSTYEYPGEHRQENRPGSDSQVRTTSGSGHFKIQRVQDPATSQAFYGITVSPNEKEPEPIGTYILAGTKSHKMTGNPTLVWKRSKSGFTDAKHVVSHPGAASYGEWLGGFIEQIAENELHKAVGQIIALGDDIWRLQPALNLGTAIAFTSNKSTGNRENVVALEGGTFNNPETGQESGGRSTGEGPSWFEPTDRSF